MSPRPESNEKRPEPGFGQKYSNPHSNLILLTRAILAHARSEKIGISNLIKFFAYSV